MIIGTTKELKNHEYRVGLTPDNVMTYVAQGHTVYVETGAGAGAGFTDEEYVAACYRHAYYQFCNRITIDREKVVPKPRTFTADVMKQDKFGNPFKDNEATITLDFVYTDGEYTCAMLILKEDHYLGKGEFEAIRAVIEDAFWLDFTFFICYNKGRICEEAYRFAKFNECVKWEMIDRLRF